MSNFILFIFMVNYAYKSQIKIILGHLFAFLLTVMSLIMRKFYVFLTLESSVRIIYAALMIIILFCVLFFSLCRFSHSICIAHAHINVCLSLRRLHDAVRVELRKITVNPALISEHISHGFKLYAIENT